MTNVTCRLTAKKSGSVPCPSHVIEDYFSMWLLFLRERLECIGVLYVLQDEWKWLLLLVVREDTVYVCDGLRLWMPMYSAHLWFSSYTWYDSLTVCHCFTHRCNKKRFVRFLLSSWKCIFNVFVIFSLFYIFRASRMRVIGRLFLWNCKE